MKYVTSEGNVHFDEPKRSVSFLVSTEDPFNDINETLSDDNKLRGVIRGVDKSSCEQIKQERVLDPSNALVFKNRKLVDYARRMYVKDKSSLNLDFDKLKYVAVHHGGVDGGHYTYYSKLDDGSWLEVNDSSVRFIELDKPTGMMSNQSHRDLMNTMGVLYG